MRMYITATIRVMSRVDFGIISNITVLTWTKESFIGLLIFTDIKIGSVIHEILL